MTPWMTGKVFEDVVADLRASSGFVAMRWTRPRLASAIRMGDGLPWRVTVDQEDGEVWRFLDVPDEELACWMLSEEWETTLNRYVQVVGKPAIEE